jgi:hypothetical protein
MASVFALRIARSISLFFRGFFGRRLFNSIQNFFAMHGHVFRRINADAHLIAFDT